MGFDAGQASRDPALRGIAERAASTDEELLELAGDFAVVDLMSVGVVPPIAHQDDSE